MTPISRHAPNSDACGSLAVCLPSSRAMLICCRVPSTTLCATPLRYTAEGTEVSLSLARHATPTEQWHVTIRDHGPGVPETMLSQLFEPFVRVGDARDRASGGYGLGLAIAQRAIRLHAGEVSARNEPGGGLTVEVRLPI